MPRRTLRGTMVAAAAVVGALAAGVSPASADTPAPGYAEFHGCPNTPNVFTCVRTVIDGGHLNIGSKDTPIQNPIELNGGIDFGTNRMVFSETGGMTSPRQRVPGGLIGLTGFEWLEDLVPLDLLKVYARAMLVGNPASPFANPMELKIKVKLENPLLSNTCFIGSDANPIVLNLTHGTTSPPPPAQPITGVGPDIVPDPERPDSLLLVGGKLVENEFAVPGASGCTMLLPGLGLIDPVVNAQSGLPAAAGQNEAVFEYDGGLAPRTSVYP